MVDSDLLILIIPQFPLVGSNSLFPYYNNLSSEINFNIILVGKLNAPNPMQMSHYYITNPPHSETWKAVEPWVTKIAQKNIIITIIIKNILLSVIPYKVFNSSKIFLAFTKLNIYNITKVLNT